MLYITPSQAAACDTPRRIEVTTLLRGPARKTCLFICRSGIVSSRSAVRFKCSAAGCSRICSYNLPHTIQPEVWLHSSEWACRASFSGFCGSLDIGYFKIVRWRGCIGEVIRRKMFCLPSVGWRWRFWWICCWWHLSEFDWLASWIEVILCCCRWFTVFMFALLWLSCGWWR